MSHSVPLLPPYPRSREPCSAAPGGPGLAEHSLERGTRDCKLREHPMERHSHTLTTAVQHSVVPPLRPNPP